MRAIIALKSHRALTSSHTSIHNRAVFRIFTLIALLPTRKMQPMTRATGSTTAETRLRGCESGFVELTRS